MELRPITENEGDHCGDLVNGVLGAAERARKPELKKGKKCRHGLGMNMQARSVTHDKFTEKTYSISYSKCGR